MKCPLCAADVPRVHGAGVQVCPACGAEIDTPLPLPAPPRAPPRRDTAGAALRAARLLVADYPAWLLLFLPFAVAALALEVASLLALRAVGYTGSALPSDPAAFALVVAIALPTAVLSFGLGAAFLGAGAAVAARRAEDLKAARPGRVRAADGVRILRERFGALVGAGVVYVSVVTAGFVLLVVPGFVFIHRYLWTTAYVGRGLAVDAAFRASHALATERRTRAYTLLVVLAWGAVEFVRLAAAAGLGPSLGGGDLGEALAAALVGLPLLPLVPALVGSLLAEADPTAAAPPPPAAPVERQVRCPGCSTVVAYAPTGGAQRVTCPSCGRSGVVRG